MVEFMLFWLAKAVVDAAIPLIACAILLVCWLCSAIPRLLHQLKCHHRSVRESRACNAVCNACGKNLGFIQTWRDTHRHKHGYTETH